MPAFNAYILICLLQIFNIGTIATVINYFLKIDMKRDIAIYTGLGLAFIMVITNRFLLYNKREFIFKRYENIPIERRTKGQIYFWLYVVLSFVIFFVAIANLITPKY